QLAERDAHRLFDDARLVHVAADLEELGALVVVAPEAGEPARAAAQDRGGDGDALDVVDRRRAAIEPRARRKRGLEPRLALLPLEAFDHRGLFAADIGAGAAVDEDVEIVTRSAGVLADQPGVIGLGHGSKQRLRLADVFAADVDIGGARTHR